MPNIGQKPPHTEGRSQRPTFHAAVHPGGTTMCYTHRVYFIFRTEYFGGIPQTPPILRAAAPTSSLAAGGILTFSNSLGILLRDDHLTEADHRTPGLLATDRPWKRTRPDPVCACDLYQIVPRTSGR
ncbi:hypothetical protein O3G_MSEX001201 [Manduca sexta]|uniref:Uncharacterized protein n=1 Tax=Manduca sexta TaxID=7130 RepID=A0A922CAG7_MANSE|nr:hypothetical protein O3G_MSEX001201 [Manduca sexta]